MMGLDDKRSSLSPSPTASLSPSPLSPRSEIAFLRSVIRTKDACLLNFSKTLRSEQEKGQSGLGGPQDQAHCPAQHTIADDVALQLQSTRNRYERLCSAHEEFVNIAHVKEEALQSEVKRLGLMLSDASDHGVLNSLQCELKAAHDEIAKMRGESSVLKDDLRRTRAQLQTSDDTLRRLALEFRQYKQSQSWAESRQSPLNYSGVLDSNAHALLQAHTEVAVQGSVQAAPDAKGALESRIQNVRSIQTQLEAAQNALSDSHAEKESLLIRTSRLHGMLSEQERLRDEAESQRRDALEQKEAAMASHEATQRLLIQSMTDLAESRELIKLQSRRNSNNSAGGSPEKKEPSPAQAQRQVPPSRVEIELMGKSELEVHIRNLRQQLKAAKEYSHSLHMQEKSIAASKSTSCNREAQPKESSEINSFETPRSPTQKQEAPMDGKASEVLSLLAQSKSREEGLTRQVNVLQGLLANDKAQKLVADDRLLRMELQMREEREGFKADMLKKNGQLETVVLNFQRLTNELEKLKGGGVVSSNVQDDLKSLEKRTMQMQIEQMKRELTTLHASHEAELRALRESQGLPGPLQSPAPAARRFPDASPLAKLGGSNNQEVQARVLRQKTEEVLRLKQQVLELSDRLSESEATVEEGKRDMLALLNAANDKERKIQELTAWLSDKEESVPAIISGNHLSARITDKMTSPLANPGSRPHTVPQISVPSSSMKGEGPLFSKQDRFISIGAQNVENFRMDEIRHILENCASAPVDVVVCKSDGRRVTIQTIPGEASDAAEQGQPHVDRPSLPASPGPDEADGEGGLGYFLGNGNVFDGAGFGPDQIYATRPEANDRSPVIARSQQGEPQLFHEPQDWIEERKRLEDIAQRRMQMLSAHTRPRAGGRRVVTNSSLM